MAASLKLGRFEFGPSSVRIAGRPPIDDWEGPLRFALWCQRASPWWIGDMLNAGDEKFGEIFFQICEGYGVSAEMVQRYKSVSRRVPPANRVPDLSWSAHAVVARLPLDQQRGMLQEAREHGWTSEEIRQRLGRKKKGPAAIAPDEAIHEEPPTKDSDDE